MMVGLGYKSEGDHAGFDMGVEECGQVVVDMIFVMNVGGQHGCQDCDFDISDLGLGLVGFPTQSWGGSSILDCKFWSMDHDFALVNYQHSWLAPIHLLPLCLLLLGLMIMW